jgi:ParB family chromosome partitioning protein
VEAAGFRLRRRGGPAEGLLSALGHKDPSTQFLAAEGLALGGRAEGLRILLTAIDGVPDLDLRRRAVRALGRLGDPRALDALLRLVGEDGHALQEDAAEAIGNLKATPKGKQIEELLLRLAKGPRQGPGPSQGTGGVAQAALAGLRWFDSREGWALVRSRIKDDDAGVRGKAVELLAFDSDPASRSALVDRVEQEKHWQVAQKAVESLRQWDPPDVLDPDYVTLGAALPGLGGDVVLARIRDRGDPARILAALPRIQAVNADRYLGSLVSILMTRDPLPVEAAAASLDSPHERVVSAAAQILGRAGRAASPAHGEALTAALRKAAESWQKVRADVQAGRAASAALAPDTDRLRRLLDAAGKLEVGAVEVVAAATLGGTDPEARPVRLAALAALSGGFAGEVGIEALAAAVPGADASARALSASALRVLAPDRASSLAEAVIDDRGTLDRLLGRGAAAAGSVLRAAAARVHTQGAALPHLVAAGDVTGLAAVLGDRKLPETTRLGAIEALGRVATDGAFEALRALASSADEDEELRKAAYRAIRRGRRYQEREEARS